MKDMNAEPKNYSARISIINFITRRTLECRKLRTIAFTNGWIELWTGGNRSQTVPIIMARPAFLGGNFSDQPLGEKKIVSTHAKNGRNKPMYIANRIP